MPAEYTLSELVKLADVSPRTVRYYIAQGLLPSPTQAGPNSRYTDVHLELLRRIKRLQSAHLPLAEIRRFLDRLPSNEVTPAAGSDRADNTARDSALDYIEAILRPGTIVPPAPSQSTSFARPAAPAAAVPAAAAPAVPAPVAPAEPVPDKPAAPATSSEPDRAQWERISLDPDIELHVRRPLTRQHNKQVERLIAIARELLKED